ncbi:MAG: flippase-like domain-containing protein [Bacteroidetes bacterium]|nr:flippase-like domain-containing protein [Bacteroidota bacterium]
MNTLKNILKYGIIMIICFFLIKQTYKGFELNEILEGIKNSNFNWLFLATVSNILSHVFRAARWRLLMLPLNFSPSIFKTFIADLSGLFANLFLPRLGEVFRCTALKRMEKIPINPSLSSVIVERSMDVIVFLLISILSFFILSKKMLIIFKLISIQNLIPSKKTFFLVLILSTLILLVLFIFRKKISIYYLKISEFIKQFLKNLKSILDNKNKLLIVVCTFYIWLFYFLSIYLVFFAINSTSHLNLDTGIIVLIASSLGLAAPIQGGGAGAMHILVIAALNIFNISKKDSILSATLIHGIQFITALLAGGISMILSFILKNNNTK